MQPLLFPNDLLKFLYWVFFKPTTLDRYIHQIDSDSGILTNLISIWIEGNTKRELRHLAKLTIFHATFTSLLTSLIAISILHLMGININWVSAGMYGLIGFLGGVSLTALLLEGVAIAVVATTAGAITGGTVLMEEWIITGGIAWLLLGMSFSVVLTSIPETSIPEFEMRYKMLIGVAFILMTSITGFSVGGRLNAATFGIGATFGYFRLPLYLIEAPLSFLMGKLGMLLTDLFPIRWDERILLPLPGLVSQLTKIARRNRAEGLVAIAEVASSFNQSWAAKTVATQLIVGDIESCKDLRDIANISNRLDWSPNTTGKDLRSLLLGINEISQHALASLESETSFNRQVQLRRGLDIIENIRRGLVVIPSSKVGSNFIIALSGWEQVFAREHFLAQQVKGIPNVYVAGSPLTLESKVFKGRRDIFRALERELTSPAEQRPALLLFGARRMGKTSVLRQLPNAIGPQVIPILVDLQSAALSDDATSLFRKIAESIQNNALVARSIILEGISIAALKKEPYSAFSDWIEKTGQLIGNRWILLCLDEYEYLEKLLLDGRIDERAFQLLRTIMQNQPRVTLLFSGAHTLENLQPLWSNYLINARIIKMTPLKKDDAEELIARPIPKFPLLYHQEALDRMLSETGCHPYLIQSTCQDLVHRLNEQSRFNATVEDVESSLNSALHTGAGYFNDLWNGPDSSIFQRAIQIEIAKTKTGKISLSRLKATLRRKEYTEQDLQMGINHLIHRDILEQEGIYLKFRFQMIRRWIKQQLV